MHEFHHLFLQALFPQQAQQAALHIRRGKKRQGAYARTQGVRPPALGLQLVHESEPAPAPERFTLQLRDAGRRVECGTGKGRVQFPLPHLGQTQPTGKRGPDAQLIAVHTGQTVHIRRHILAPALIKELAVLQIMLKTARRLAGMVI